jgi:hypothetical protein
MGCAHLIKLLSAAFEQPAEGLRALGYDAPWPQELRAQDIVCLLKERTDWLGLGLEQAGFYQFGTEDDGFGGRTGSGSRLHLQNLGCAS